MRTFGLFLILCCVFIFIKNYNTFRVRTKIDNAIYKYNMYCINAGTYNTERIKYNDEESYESTMFRVFDWGYKNILPPDKFEKVKMYIK